MFWLASKAYAFYVLLCSVATIYFVTQNKFVEVGVLALLFIPATVIYLEWKNGG